MPCGGTGVLQDATRPRSGVHPRASPAPRHATRRCAKRLYSCKRSALCRARTSLGVRRRSEKVGVHHALQRQLVAQDDRTAHWHREFAWSAQLTPRAAHLCGWLFACRTAWRASAAWRPAGGQQPALPSAAAACRPGLRRPSAGLAAPPVRALARAPRPSEKSHTSCSGSVCSHREKRSSKYG
jgi:hypothetical protein